MKTTLNLIRKANPCKPGWETLLRGLCKTCADDEPLHLRTVLEINGVDDALWCLRAVEGYDREMRLYAVWCARQIQHLMTDPRSIAALDVAEKFANGLATIDELDAAESAAEAAEAAEAARAARAARDAAEATARDAARDAAWDAAWAALAARAAAEAAEAAWAAWAARAAAQDAARDAARADTRSAQTTEFRRMLDCIDAGERYEIMEAV